MSTILGLFGCGLLCLAVAASAMRLRRLPINARIAAMSVAALAVFVPLGDLSIAAYVRGVTGDLSLATLVLGGAACAAQLSGRTAIEPRDLRAVAWFVVSGAAFLYPFALGWTRFDSYALGYGSVEFVTALLLVTFAAWHFRRTVVAIIVIAAALAYLVGAYESRNLWDYLIDPLVACYALIWLPARARRRPGERAEKNAQGA